MTTTLNGRIALVTGASRGLGKGIALALGAEGARVYITGRTLESEQGAPSLRDVEAQFESLPGECTPIGCDHTDDAQTERAFDMLFEREGRLDLLVNSAWGGYQDVIESGNWEHPFWRQPVWRWDAMFNSGLRPTFVCSRLAAAKMVEQSTGLIVNLSYWAAQKYIYNAIYGAAKCATDRLTRDMARELADTSVTAVSLYPGIVKTELVLEYAEYQNLENAETPEFTGRAIAHLLADPNVRDKNGQVLVAAELAREYGFTDVDGSKPAPLKLDTAPDTLVQG